VTARTTIEAKAWTDIRFATLARLLALADADHAIIRTARLWSWQTEHYTPEAPTYVVDVDTIESALGVVGAAGALVRARLAEETPEGYRICGAVGRIEWLWKKKQSSILGGEATKSKHANRSRPIGLPPGQSSGLPVGSPITSNGEPDRETEPIGLPHGQPIGRPDGRPSSLLSGEEFSPARAIPPDQAPSALVPPAPPPPILPGSIARAEARRRLIGAAWQLAGDAFRELARAASRGSLASKALGKRTFYRQIDLDVEAAYAEAIEVMAHSALTPDGREAMRAFIEKRPAVYAPPGSPAR
jgi:hypothetical protein